MVRSGSRLCARHCADQFAPRHLDAVGTVGPCASTTSCHPRVGLVRFSLGFHLLLLVQPDAYLLGNHVALCKFCINLVVSSTVKLMPSPMMNTSGSQRLTSGTHTVEASTRTLYTWSGANKYMLLPASG